MKKKNLLPQKIIIFNAFLVDCNRFVLIFVNTDKETHL